MSRPMNRRDERGSALVELTWLGLLLLVPLLWIVLSVFEVQRGAFAVSGAARAAGRAYALAPSDELGQQRAQAAANQVLVDHGVGDQPLGLTVTCAPAGDCHAPGAVVTVDLHSRVDLPLLPDVLGGGAPSFALNASHTVPIGQFRDTQLRDNQ
jgi:Flp pilus assembly protein TadG